MIYSDNIITAQSEEDIEQLLKKYSCKDVAELADCLWFTYGITLIDESPASEYLQVEAQKSPEFYAEALTPNDVK